MSLAQDGDGSAGPAAQPYVSALDLGGGGAGAAPSAAVPAEGTAPALSGPEAPQAEPAPDVKLEERLKTAMLDAKGPAMIDTLHEIMNAGVEAADHVPKGPIDLKLHEWENKGVVRRAGDQWELTATARAEVEAPEAVVARRTELLATMLLMFMPNGDDFDPKEIQGANHIELAAVLRGDEEAGAGAVTPTGYVHRILPEDVLIADLEAMAGAGLLLKRTALEEDAVRGIVPSEPEEEEDEDENDEEGDEEEDEEAKAPPVDGRPPAYTFAEGIAFRILAQGAPSVARTSVPAAAPMVAAAAAESVQDGVAFQRKLGAELEAARREIDERKRYELRLRTILAGHKLEFFADQAREPPTPPPGPVRSYFDYTQTVGMTERELVILFRQVEDIDRQIAVEKGKEAAAKMALSTVKADVKEELAKLEDRKKLLLAESHGSSRTYTVQAYVELDYSGDRTIKITKARDDDRVLSAEVLAPATPAGLASIAGVKEQVAPSASSAAPAAGAVPAPGAPPEDAAARDAAAAEAQKKAEGEAALARSKGKIEISVAGLTPYVIAVIVAAGTIPEDEVPPLVAALAGRELDGPLNSIIRAALGKLGAVGVEFKDRQASFGTKQAILGLVAEAGDTGLRVNDLVVRFAEKTGSAITAEVKAALDKAVTAAVESADLHRAPLPGDMGDLLWLTGQTDPRRLAGNPPAPAAPAPAPTAPAPKASGRGRRGKAAAAAVGTPPQPEDGAEDTAAPKARKTKAPKAGAKPRTKKK